MTAFDELLNQHQKIDSKVATKEEEAEKARNKQLLTEVANYSVDNIVRGTASLQLDFSSNIDLIKEKLAKESFKLDEFKKAIAVEREHLKKLSQVRLVADALHILQQEHQEKLKQLVKENSLQQEKITQEMHKYKKIWEQEEANYLIKIEEEDRIILNKREKEEADYKYELNRQKTIENDEYEEDCRQQARELTEISKEKEKDWSKRELYLARNQAEYNDNKEKIGNFEEKIKTEYNKAKGDAIKETLSKAKVEADLLEKEWESARQGYNFQIASLESAIASNEKQIEELKARLQESSDRAQNLALKAFSN